ncbi:MAG: hypothetical protein F4Y70_12370 [Chloroflexi bacterium]|nr:hypothetical protein [Chloroflexota bacterium]
MLQKRWALVEESPEDGWLRSANTKPALAQVLHNRGFADPQAAQQFLHSRDLHEAPLAMKDMPKAVERINRALLCGELIAIYGDYDADGVCATALLLTTLQKLGGNAIAHIPHRDAGYGLSKGALNRLAEAGARLVVTVDCGIRSVAEVAAGNALGLDFIISDHHSIGAVLPPALAVVNPRQKECPGEARLSGSGVAFMLALALLKDRWANDRANYPPGLRISDLLDLVALGTVADVMPLNVSLNRRLVAHGLAAINEGRRAGIAALAAVARLRLGTIQASDLAFRLGPRINAAGRLGSAEAALELLLAESPQAARTAAQRLQQLNQRRQMLTSAAQAAVDSQLEQAARETSAACQSAAAIIQGADRRMAGFLRPTRRNPTRQLARLRQVALQAEREITRIAGAESQWPLRQASTRWSSAICAIAKRAQRNYSRLSDCRARAKLLCKLEAERKKISALARAEIRRIQADAAEPMLIFAAGDEEAIPAGIAGLVAGRLTEAHYRPTVIVSLGDGESRASCRSISEFNITRALDACAHLLVRHGGHAEAAGFTVRNENLPALRQLLEKLVDAQLRGKALAPALSIDAPLQACDWNEKFLQELKALEPTGQAFPPAAFMTDNLRVLAYRTVGQEGKHLKLRVEKDGARIDAIGFGLGAWAANMPSHIDAAYHFESNEFNGRRSLQLHLLDIRPARQSHQNENPRY